jgi:hypothetical protein
MNKKILILGDHLLAEDLIRQYKEKGCVVEHRQEVTTKDVNINDYDEMCLLTSVDDSKKVENDNRVVSLLSQLVADYDVAKNGGRKLVCHLLVQSRATLRMLQTTDFCEAIRQKTDVYPFTMDEVWARSIMLDYEPVTIRSEKHAHLVIFGMGEMAEMVAIHTTLAAHYPNYVRNHSLRTRITMIDEKAERKSETFIKNYRHLFDNSYYRVVKPSDEKAVKQFHHPMYDGRREDFVDVEWEFVEAPGWNVDLREKLQSWAADEKQLLTVVMADKDGNKNLNEALHLPETLFQQHIPIYIYSQQEINSVGCPNIRTFGMIDRGYDVTLPLVRMAKNVNYIYDRCYDENFGNGPSFSDQLHYAVEIDEEERDRSWARLSNVKRMSSICNAMTIETKMRSIGLEENDWEKFYDIPQQDIEILAQVEHNRWSVEELVLGFRPCTDEEQQEIEADISQKKVFKQQKIHYDLRAYHDLRPDETGKSVEVYDLCLCSCLPLIAKAFVDEEGGAA